MPTLIIRRIDGSELFRDDRDYRNFREALSYLPGEDGLEWLTDGCRAVAEYCEMKPFKAVVRVRLYLGTAQQCGELICSMYDYHLRLRYSLTGRQTTFIIC